MNKYPNSTYRVLAYKEIQDTAHYDLVVDWAVEMLQYGYETEHLLMLAGITKPTDHFECEQYLEATLKEVGLEPILGDDAIVAFAWTSVKDLSLGIKLDANLDRLGSLYLSTGYRDNWTSDFFRLHNAWTYKNLEEGDDDYATVYWDAATRDNIEEVVINYAKDWLKRYEPVICKLLPQ